MNTMKKKEICKILSIINVFFFILKLHVYLVRRIKCNPESVSIILDIFPTLRANAASSNGFCI